MRPVNQSLDALRQQEYEWCLLVNRLRREIYEQADPSASDLLLTELAQAEKELSAIEKARADAQTKDPIVSGIILDAHKSPGLLGSDTTGLDARVHLRMAQLPTSICHLMNKDQNPLGYVDEFIP